MFKNLLQVKKIIALLLTAVFCYMAIMGRITPEQYLTVFSIVIAFYFGQSTARQAATEVNKLDAGIPQVPKTINPVNITNDIK